jgi:hypothetical protein
MGGGHLSESTENGLKQLFSGIRHDVENYAAGGSGARRRVTTFVLRGSVAVDRANVKSVLKLCGLKHTITRALGLEEVEPTTDSLLGRSTGSTNPTGFRGWSHFSTVADSSARGDTGLDGGLECEDRSSANISTPPASIARPESVHSSCSQAPTLYDMNPHTFSQP